VWSSLEDLARWDAGLRQNRLVKPETMRPALQPSKTADGKTNTYGFGWEMAFDGKGRVTDFWHDGKLWSGLLGIFPGQQ